MPKTLNIAVIGAGTMAQAVHLPVLRRRWDRFAVTALVDHSPRRRRESAEVWGIEEERRHETVADLIAAVRAKSVTVDAALLSTDGLHVEDLLQLMRRGIPVLVEPPLGFSAEEIAKVADFERMTGRRLVMMAYPQQYDDSVQRMAEQIAVKDLRMVDHEVLMPASQPLFSWAHVTTSAYDLPSEVRSQRRSDLQAAVIAGSGQGATQRDRDLYVKGLLTGLAHQMAVLEAVYGPITHVAAVRHWPQGVIPGSLEVLGELEGGARVRLVWHYLPFAPEYSEQVQVLSARRRMRVELPAPSHGDRRSTVSLREKKTGIVQETASVATKGAAEAMWEAFHGFVDKGREPVAGAAEALTQVALMREVLATIVEADGRSIDPDPEEESESASEEESAAQASEEESESASGEEPAPAETTPDEAAGTEEEPPTTTTEEELATPATDAEEGPAEPAHAPEAGPGTEAAESEGAASAGSDEPGSPQPDGAGSPQPDGAGSPQPDGADPEPGATTGEVDVWKLDSEQAGGADPDVDRGDQRPQDRRDQYRQDGSAEQS